MAALLVSIDLWLAQRGDRGASLVEYALLIALITLVCFAAVGYIGGQSQSFYTNTGASLQGN